MSKIVKIQWGYLTGKRIRHAGCNARLGEHGEDIREPYAHITLNDGCTGFGYANLSQDKAQSFLGKQLDELISVKTGTYKNARILDFALWDTLGKQKAQPIYSLINSEIKTPYSVACYDTSLYMNDLNLSDDKEAAQLIASHAKEGFERGHRAFKMKVGRGAMHMDLDTGTNRDIAVICAVREAIGSNAKLMIDANNGYNLNITKHVLSETADCNIYWIEEAFQEDAVLYQHLLEWIEAKGLSTLIADGEGQNPHPQIMTWAKQGCIQVLQHTLLQHGFSTWLGFGKTLDTYNIQSAPNNYGSAFGEYASCHLSAAIEHFSFVESDVVHMDGLDGSGYKVSEGTITVPNKPGFGLSLDVNSLKDGFIVKL